MPPKYREITLRGFDEHLFSIWNLVLEIFIMTLEIFTMTFFLKARMAAFVRVGPTHMQGAQVRRATLWGRHTTYPKRVDILSGGSYPAFSKVKTTPLDELAPKGLTSSLVVAEARMNHSIA